MNESPNKEEETIHDLLTNNGEQVWMSNRVEEHLLGKNSKLDFVIENEDDSQKKQKEKNSQWIVKWSAGFRQTLLFSCLFCGG